MMGRVLVTDSFLLIGLDDYKLNPIKPIIDIKIPFHPLNPDQKLIIGGSIVQN